MSILKVTGGTIMAGILLFFSSFMSVTSAAPVAESDLDLCEADSDCIIVPYEHCCGNRQRSINKKWKTLYEATPAWQQFNDAGKCAVMGACMAVYNSWRNVHCIGGNGNPKRCEIIP